MGSGARFLLEFLGQLYMFFFFAFQMQFSSLSTQIMFV